MQRVCKSIGIKAAAQRPVAILDRRPRMLRYPLLQWGAYQVPPPLGGLPGLPQAGVKAQHSLVLGYHLSR
jgi:hypothetical protein